MLSPEKIAAMTDAQLKALADNVARLVVSGTLAQVGEAARLGPMIEEEQAARAAAKPAAIKKAAKPATPKKAPAKKKTAKAKPE